MDITGTTVFSLELEVSGWKENKCLKAINIRGAAMLACHGKNVTLTLLVFFGINIP